MKTISRKPRLPGAEAPSSKLKAQGKHQRPTPKPKRAGLSSSWVRTREDSLELGSWSFFGPISPVLVAVLLAVSFSAAHAADAGGGDMIECANLIYAGTKSSVCFSEEFLSAVAAETSICAARKFKPVKLGENEVFKFPFAVMTGEGGFSLTDSERRNLRVYLQKGGFLLASAGCSSKEWSDSFQREIDALFPDRQLAEVSMDHPLFRTVYDVKRLDMSHGGTAKLLGLTLGGKIALIVSTDGLNDTGTMHGCCCCGGNEIKNAQKVNGNILAYALLQ